MKCRGFYSNIILMEANAGRMAELNGILKRFGVRREFPPEVSGEVEALVADPGITDSSLVDMTHLPFVTIDNDDSRDLDQAVQIEGDLKNFVVRYALADASFYVKPGSPLFKEAVKRGASYYLPHLCVPMLPPELSEGIVSLNPGVERRAMVFVMRLDADGEVVSTEIFRARIRSRAKLSYNGVQAFYDNPKESDLSGQEFTQTLELLERVGKLRIDAAIAKGVIQYNRVEEEIRLNPEGTGFVIQQEKRNNCSRYNEQISLLCNEEGAKFIAGKDPRIHPIFRIHEAPPPESFQKLEHMITQIVSEHQLDPEVWEWSPEAETLSDYLDRIFNIPHHQGVASAIERQILITNQRSMFADEQAGHYALGVDLYSRFSAPMREIVGIFTHKEAFEKLGQTPLLSPEDDEAYRKAIIKSGNRAREIQKNIEKAVNRLVVDQLFSSELKVPLDQRKIHSGTILGIKASRLYVRLDDIPLEIKVYTSGIEKQQGQKLNYQKDNVFINSPDNNIRFAIGSKIQLKTTDYLQHKHKWILLPV